MNANLNNMMNDDFLSAMAISGVEMWAKHEQGEALEVYNKMLEVYNKKPEIFKSLASIFMNNGIDMMLNVFKDMD